VLAYTLGRLHAIFFLYNLQVYASSSADSIADFLIDAAVYRILYCFYIFINSGPAATYATVPL